MKIRALLAFFVLAACGSDTDNNPLTETEQNVIGKWQLQSISRNGAPFALGQCEDQNTIDFKNTGAFTQLNYGILEGGTICAIDSVVNASYQIENDSIFFTINTLDTIYKARILEVSTDGLRINSRMYMPVEEEGMDEVIFTKVTP
ncbi:MAG: lipocalin family protein [Bacteroidota bacterium]